MVRITYFACRLTVVCLIVFPLFVANAQSGDASLVARQRLIRELAQGLLGSPDGDPVSVGGKKGWRGVVLAPPGTALSSLMTPFDVMSSDTMNIPKLLENVSTFDRPFVVSNGVGNAGAEPLAQVWDKVLKSTRPTFSPVESEIENDATVKWLFRAPDSIDKARGVRYIREPSDAMIRYREYESLYRAIVSAERNDDSFWRSNPRLSQYSTILEAKAGVAQDWITYGFKREIEAAREAFISKTGSSSWTDWSGAQAQFAVGRIPINPVLSVPLTLLFPSPAEWINMGSWRRTVGNTSNTNIGVTFQYARISIMRPWFAIELLLDGRLRIRRHAKGQEPYIVSDGVSPTALSYPLGAMGTYPEEIIIVREVRFVVKNSSPEVRSPPDLNHPLGQFSYPDDINLLGYVVRALPRLGE